MKIGIIEFLSNVVDAPDANIEIAQDEIIDLLWDADDSFLVGEGSITFSFQAPPWYTASGSPTGYVGFCQAS